MHNVELDACPNINRVERDAIVEYFFFPSPNSMSAQKGGNGTYDETRALIRLSLCVYLISHVLVFNDCNVMHNGG